MTMVTALMMQESFSLGDFSKSSSNRLNSKIKKESL